MMWLVTEKWTHNQQHKKQKNMCEKSLQSLEKFLSYYVVKMK